MIKMAVSLVSGGSGLIDNRLILRKGVRCPPFSGGEHHFKRVEFSGVNIAPPKLESQKPPCLHFRAQVALQRAPDVAPAALPRSTWRSTTRQKVPSVSFPVFPCLKPPHPFQIPEGENKKNKGWPRPPATHYLKGQGR